MATRPVFVPDTNPDHPQLVHEHEVDFQWLPGRSLQQKKANIAKLHVAAGRRNLAPLLHVTPESDDPLGILVAAANLAIEAENSFLFPLEAVYKGSMVFTGGGPFTDMYRMRDVKIAADARLMDSGNPIGFKFMNLEWGLKSGTMFYDWLVIHSIHRYVKLRSGIRRFKGFTEVDCQSFGHSVCHARSCALYVALAEKRLMDDVIRDQDLFIWTLAQDSFYKTNLGGDGDHRLAEKP